MTRVYTIADCNVVAKQFGGRCLSPRYVDVHTQLDWQCAQGHRWPATWDRVNRLKKWCPACACVPVYTIADLRTLARTRGGDCLSDAYVNSRTALRWRCEHGHEWDGLPTRILNGGWCPICIGRTPWTLERAREWARERGGECLGETEERAVYRWRCSSGHRWTGLASAIQEGHWCAVCAANKPLTLADLQRTARERRGRCLAEAYEGSRVKVEWECGKGHRWFARPLAVRAGSWCPECGIAKRRRPTPRLDIEDMRAAADERGGKCLSVEYVPKQKLLWECAAGHRWEALGTAVRYGRWCPRCAGVASPTLDELQALAAEHGGECLSKRYRGTHKKLRWQCAAGHMFQAAPSSLKRGRFCPECRPWKPGTLAEMKTLAAERGGKCLSRSYADAHTHLEWSCRAGHRWHAVPASIKCGSWCPQCARQSGARAARQTLEARALRNARRRGSFGSV